MTKSEFVDRLADELNINRREAKAMLDAVLEGIAHALVTEGHLALRGFGTFEARRRGLRPVSKISEGEGGTPGQSGVHFRPSTPLRSRLDARSP